jgi:hypothetical protein
MARLPELMESAAWAAYLHDPKLDRVSPGPEKARRTEQRVKMRPITAISLHFIDRN